MISLKIIVILRELSKDSTHQAIENAEKILVWENSKTIDNFRITFL